MAENDPKWPKEAQKGPKWPKNDPKWPNKFPQFFLTEKVVPQTFSLLECMIVPYI